MSHDGCGCSLLAGFDKPRTDGGFTSFKDVVYTFSTYCKQRLEQGRADQRGAREGVRDQNKKDALLQQTASGPFATARRRDFDSADD